MIKIHIPGRPTPYKSPRVYQTACFNPLSKKKHEMQKLIREQYHGRVLDSAVRVDYIFNFSIPISYSKRKIAEIEEGKILFTCRPDCSNLNKFFDDCLIGTVLKDDSLIVHCTIQKKYAKKNSTEVVITLLSL